MIRVTYVSREAPGLTSDKLLALVSQCHRNNPDKGLTGMLLHGNGTFLQVLEGDDHVVDTLIGAIAADPRHIDMKIVRREPVTRRQFADWSMGFERVTDESLKGVSGLHDFGLLNFTPEFLSGHDDVVETLLERHRAPPLGSTHSRARCARQADRRAASRNYANAQRQRDDCTDP